MPPNRNHDNNIEHLVLSDVGIAWKDLQDFLHRFKSLKQLPFLRGCRNMNAAAETPTIWRAWLELENINADKAGILIHEDEAEVSSCGY